MGGPDAFVLVSAYSYVAVFLGLVLAVSVMMFLVNRGAISKVREAISRQRSRQRKDLEHVLEGDPDPLVEGGDP